MTQKVFPLAMKIFANDTSVHGLVAQTNFHTVLGPHEGRSKCKPKQKAVQPDEGDTLKLTEIQC